jgi:uncharacterized RmlC-like cupin family protein
MAKRSASKLVIKSLGKRSGTISAPALSRIVHEARDKYRGKQRTDTALDIEDTATGSGRIKFHVPVPPQARRTKAA